MAKVEIGSIPPSMRLENLQNEPVRLKLEAENLNEELDDLVMDNYRVFVENLTCSAYLRDEDKRLENSSNELKSNLQQFSVQCSSFKEKVNYYINAHKRNRKTLKHNLQLVELLEIPQLVEACSRNGFHDEALELALFANSLESKFLLANELRNQQELISKDISQLSSSSSVKSSTGQNIVQNIVNDVHKTLSELRCHLLQKLSEEAALPKLLTILSSLRKLDGILVDRKLFLDNHLVVAHQTTSASASASTSSTISSSSSPISLENSNHQYEIMSQYIETSLQMSYLEARSIWIQRMISNVYTSSYNADLQNKILMNSLEINSEIQSNSPSKTTILSPPPLVRASSSSNQSSHLGSYGKGIEILEIYRSSWFSVITQFNALFLNSNSSNTTTTSCSSITLLSHWIQDQIQHFIDDIHVILQEIDEIVSFKLFYEQVLLFSIRMSEIGCDFKEFTIPIFNRNLKNRIETIWIQGINQFQQMILTEKYTPAVMTGGDDMNELENEYQVIPLYMQQELLENEDHGGGDEVVKKGHEPHYPLMTPPQEIVAYPPLAFLLNSFLIGLNYLKDCPLISLQSHMTTQLQKYFFDISKFVSEHAEDIKQKGKKYFISSGAHSKKILDETTMMKSQESMDELYFQYLQHILEFVLKCFQLIYSDDGKAELDPSYQEILVKCRQILHK